jgi:hypothetical protein
MKPARSLRIPLVLTWTALSGASVGVVAAACSSSTTSGPNAADSSVVESSSAQDSTTAMESAAPDAPVAPAECQEVDEAGFVYFVADGATCPDGDTTIVV